MRDIEPIQNEFEAVGERIAALDNGEDRETPDVRFLEIKYYSVYSIWKARLARQAAGAGECDKTEATRLWNVGTKIVDDFIAEFPESSLPLLARIDHSLAKLYVVDAEDPEFGRVTTEMKDAAINAADELVKRFPDSPYYAERRLLTYYYFAKMKAICREFGESAELLNAGAESVPEFCDKFYAPEERESVKAAYRATVASARAELCVAQGEFDEAERQIESLKNESQTCSENADAQRVLKFSKTPEELEKTLAEARENAALK
ncbi:MAG: hypothetical protein HUK22_08410 [Thermoguttaceae bacterium]|nr:hypothetical protein [Thermoguttaceae bacterium]